MLVKDRIKGQDAMLIANAYVEYGCENLVSVNISVLCSYVRVLIPSC